MSNRLLSNVVSLFSHVAMWHLSVNVESTERYCWWHLGPPSPISTSLHTWTQTKQFVLFLVFWIICLKIFLPCLQVLNDPLPESRDVVELSGRYATWLNGVDLGAYVRKWRMDVDERVQCHWPIVCSILLFDLPQSVGNRLFKKVYPVV